MKNLQRLPNQFLATLTLAISALLFTSNTFAIGPIVTNLTKVIEGAKITLQSGSDKTQGHIVATLKICENCESKSYPFGADTTLINPMGAERPINELHTWNNSTAMLVIRLSDNFVEKIQILTNDE